MRRGPTEIRAGSGSEFAGAGYSESAPRRPSLVREVALILGLFLVYRVARLVIAGQDDIAVSNAWWVWGAERALRLPDEEILQQWVLQWPFRPPAEYRWARRLITLLTALAVVVHVLMPLAPPRMLSSLGFLDTMAVFGPSAYGESTGNLANQFAAMPSLHVGWALLIAVVVVRTLTGPARWLVVLHPAITVVVVVATANHYWIDAIAAALLLAVAVAVVPAPDGPSPAARLLARRQQSRSGAPRGTSAVVAGPPRPRGPAD